MFKFILKYFKRSSMFCNLHSIFYITGEIKFFVRFPFINKYTKIFKQKGA